MFSPRRFVRQGMILSISHVVLEYFVFRNFLRVHENFLRVGSLGTKRLFSISDHIFSKYSEFVLLDLKVH